MPAGTNLPDGVYNLWAYSYDRAGNSTTAFIQVTVDVTVPTVSFTTSTTTPVGTTPVSGSTVSSTIPAITGIAADSGSGVARVDVRLYRSTATSGVYEYWTGNTWSSATTDLKTVLNPTAGGANVTWSKSSGWPSSTNFTSGTYYLRALAYDKAGNSTVTLASNFKKGTSTAASPNEVSASGEAIVSSQSIQLSFACAIDVETATKQFVVAVNGVLVSVNAIEVAQNNVLLLLAENALREGDTVKVNWQGLKDANGAALADGQWQGPAQ